MICNNYSNCSEVLNYFQRLPVLSLIAIRLCLFVCIDVLLEKLFKWRMFCSNFSLRGTFSFPDSSSQVYTVQYSLGSCMPLSGTINYSFIEVMHLPRP